MAPRALMALVLLLVALLVYWVAAFALLKAAQTMTALSPAEARSCCARHRYRYQRGHSGRVADQVGLLLTGNRIPQPDPAIAMTVGQEPLPGGQLDHSRWPASGVADQFAVLPATHGIP
jgi:hypothetical protein